MYRYETSLPRIIHQRNGGKVLIIGIMFFETLNRIDEVCRIDFHISPLLGPTIVKKNIHNCDVHNLNCRILVGQNQVQYLQELTAY